ncbi:hypothetical protein Lal_00025655 [Lupinus albus]|nr:hypothetical protein Lal_00025655 [Lupinus albus]
MGADTTIPSYWLNWRFFICAVFILIAMSLASFLIWKYEEFNKSKRDRRRRQEETAPSLYKDEAWNTCVKIIHPAWLLCYRTISFIVLLSLLIANVVADGGGIFYFYTHNNVFRGNSDNHSSLDSEQGMYVAPTLDGTTDVSNLYKSSGAYQEPQTQDAANIWGYIFQILFQTCAGAVVLTDCVFWLIIYPFLTAKDFSLDYLIVCMHSLNAVFLLGDTALNCMRFPMFRFAYFVMWTAIFVVFQWIIHMCVSLWWPYPFLDLASPYAPLWYLAVGVMHIPCYGIFALIVRLKHSWLLRVSPGSCQFLR